eukprot:1127236-Pleurochrysis_carterae.AAC.1
MILWATSSCEPHQPVTQIKQIRSSCNEPHPATQISTAIATLKRSIAGAARASGGPPLGAAGASARVARRAELDSRVLVRLRPRARLRSHHARRRRVPVRRATAARRGDLAHAAPRARDRVAAR